MPPAPDTLATRIASARLSKAQRLAARLRADGITAALAAQADAEWWFLAAKAASTRMPSEATRELVCELLREREAGTPFRWRYADGQTLRTAVRNRR